LTARPRTGFVIYLCEFLCVVRCSPLFCGGLKLLFVGDFLQLPPVEGAPLFSGVDEGTYLESVGTPGRLWRNLLLPCSEVVYLSAAHRFAEDPNAEVHRRHTNESRVPLVEISSHSGVGKPAQRPPEAKVGVQGVPPCLHCFAMLSHCIISPCFDATRHRYRLP
jgi:hypothetical protein